jgi:hypothetical protein
MSNPVKPIAKKARPKPGKPGQCLHCGETVARKGIGYAHAATAAAECSKG